MPQVPNFSPAKNGFAFANRFPEVPMEIDLLGRTWNLLNASGGLCGGMTFLTCDHFLAGIPMPKVDMAPGAGPLFHDLCQRQVHSFDLPQGFLRYLLWMNPLRPEKTGSWLRSLRDLALQVEWPRIRARLDAGRLAPLSLVHVRSWNPRDVGKNHQVLAYGYTQEASSFQILVLDPNHPGDDSIRIAFDLQAIDAPLGWNGSSTSLLGFFLSRYEFQAP